MQRLEELDAWLAASGPVRFELDPGARAFPQGWVLLTCQLTRTILDGSAQLLIEADGGQACLDIPVSPGGSVFELVKLPPGIRRMVWQPSQCNGTFKHSALRLRKVPLARRLWLMGRRVAFMLWKRPSDQKQRAGLSWYRPFFDLPGQYRACGRLRAYAHGMQYAQWLSRHALLTDMDRKLIRRRIRRLRARPHFAIVVVSSGLHGEDLPATLASIEAQLYHGHSAVTARPGEAVALAPEARYVMLLDAGDRLAEHALYWFAEAIAARRDVVLAYGDEDVIDASGERSGPRFKPDWSPEHLSSIDYIGRCAVLRRRELEACGGVAQASADAHGVLLRLTRGGLPPESVVHVPALLMHRSVRNPPPAPRPRTRYPLPAERPLVSIVIPTRDALPLLRNCLDSIKLRSSYRNYEILVVDNRSRDANALDYLARLEHRVLRYDAEFNYSAINNKAARAARGRVLLLLNNDTEVISADWIEELLGHLHQDGVGVVGAKLYYPNGTVQHAGDAVGPGGCSDHLHSGLARDAAGYCHRALIAHEVSAVTGACLMTWKHLYLRLGGLDEARLPVSFNDVDYCLRVQQAGYRVVFTPHAELYHHESASRRPSPREVRDVRTMRQRWRARLARDPYYNPNLNYERPDFALAEPPRVNRPWLK